MIEEGPDHAMQQAIENCDSLYRSSPANEKPRGDDRTDDQVKRSEREPKKKKLSAYSGSYFGLGSGSSQAKCMIRGPL